MSYTKETIDGKTIVKIDASLTIYDAPALHEELLCCFEEGGEIVIDVEEVDECDPAGIQLLCAARKNARENRQPFRIAGASEKIMETLQRLGLDTDEII